MLRSLLFHGRALPARIRRAFVIYPYECLFGALLVVLAIPFLAKAYTEWDDVYIAASTRLLKHQDLYGRGTNFTYPPFMSFAVIPFAMAGSAIGRLAWFSVNAVSLWVLMWGAWRLSGGTRIDARAPGSWREQLIFWLGAGCGIRFILNGFSHLQTDVLIGALMLSGCLSLRRGRSLWAATLMGIAAAVKGPALLWAGYFAYRRDVRSLAWMLTVVLVTSLLPDLVSRPPQGGLWLTRWYRTQVAGLQSPDRYPGVWASLPELNQSVAGLVNRVVAVDRTTIDGKYHTTVSQHPLMSPTSSKWIVKSICGALLAATVGIGLWRWWRGNHSPPEATLPYEASMIVMLMLLFSPMSSKSHFATLVLPGFCLARSAVADRNRMSAVWLALALLMTNAGWSIFGDQVAFLTLYFGLMTIGTVSLLVGNGVLLAQYRESSEQALPETEPLRRAA